MAVKENAPAVKGTAEEPISVTILRRDICKSAERGAWEAVQNFGASAESYEVGAYAVRIAGRGRRWDVLSHIAKNAKLEEVGSRAAEALSVDDKDARSQLLHSCLWGKSDAVGKHIIDIIAKKRDWDTVRKAAIFCDSEGVSRHALEVISKLERWEDFERVGIFCCGNMSKQEVAKHAIDLAAAAQQWVVLAHIAAGDDMFDTGEYALQVAKGAGKQHVLDFLRTEARCPALRELAGGKPADGAC